MSKPSSRSISFVATLAIAAAACGAPADSERQEHFESTSTALDVGPSSVPFPVKVLGSDIQYDPVTGRPLPSWPGTIVDLMATDAWAQCSAHASGLATDRYLEYLQTRITQSECPNAVSQTLPLSSFNIRDCGTTASTCSAPIKRWARQRQIPRCNVNTSTGVASTVRFYDNSKTGHTLIPSTFAPLGGTASIRDGAVAAAQAEIDTAEVNLCMAQRLRENVASADSLFLSAEDLRQLLEVIRERAQVAMVQYALLARAFTNPDDRQAPPTSPYQAFIPLMYWAKIEAATISLSEMGRDSAAAVQLHIDTTRELAELLVRSASARVRRGGSPTNSAQEDFGAGSWRQRLLALLYGGNPMKSGEVTGEIDLSKLSDPDVAGMSDSQESVPWETAWTEDGSDWNWPNQLPPLTPSQRYATTPTSDPHVQQFLALARKADALYLKERNADFLWSFAGGEAGTLPFRRVDIDGSAPWVWSLVEAWLQTQNCKKTSPSCAIAVNDPTMPTVAGYGSSILWAKYGIQPAHAKTLVSMLADITPAHSESSHLKLIFPTMPSQPLEVHGARHVTGKSRTLSAADVAARLPGQEGGTWYRLDPKFDVLPLGIPERAPLYTYVSPYFLPRVFDKLNVPKSQGFGQGTTVKRLGAISALTATRNLLEDAMTNASTALKASYLAKVPRSLAAISSAIGERSITIRPSLSTKDLYRYCDDFDSPGAASTRACPTIIQTTTESTAGWDISIRTEVDDPFADGFASLVIVPFKGGIESAAAFDPSYSSFKGETRATLLWSTERIEVPISTTPIGTTAKQGVVHVELPRVLLNAQTAVPNAPLGAGAAFSVFLKRTRPGNINEDYQLLAQRLVLGIDRQERRVGNGATSESIALPRDGQFIAYGGTLGQMASRAWATLAHDWSKPAYDGFGLPIDWIPPSDPSLFGGSSGDDAVSAYLRTARSAADEATNAVKNAIDELLKEQADDATLATAQRKATEIAQLEQRALCGDAKPNCDTSTYDFNLYFDPPSGDRYLPQMTCATLTLCADIERLNTKVLPNSVRLARVVYEHRNDAAPPAFNDYAGGTLQKVLVQQWIALRNVKNAVKVALNSLASHDAQLRAAEEEFFLAHATREHECNDRAFRDAWYSSFSYSIDVDDFNPYSTMGPENGWLPENSDDKRTWSPGALLAQKRACDRAAQALPASTARFTATIAESWVWLSSQTTQLIDAGSVLQVASIELAKALQDTNLAKAAAQLEASIAGDTLVTKFGTYRRYHSYDVWRARALLESTRRYAVAARRAIEARYVVDLSTMRSDEPFVAAPATWADEIYEYDLAAPTSVGLTVSPQSGTGIYPNRLIDYVGNLERFVNGYAVARPTAVADRDDELFHVVGPDARFVPNGSTQKVLAGQVAAWEFLCPNGTGWVQHPGLASSTPNAPISELCVDVGDVSPTRARVNFDLDPWGRLNGDVAEDLYAKRHNARWTDLVVNLVGTGVRDCTKSPDPPGCYANSYIRYDLTHAGPMWLTNYDEQWRALGFPVGRIEGAKALAAEQWLDPVGNGFSKPYVSEVARSEFRGRPMGGSYRLEIQLTPDVRLDRIDRVQVLTRSGYWVKQL